MLKIDLRNKNGNIEHFQEAFVPTSKLIEGLKLTPENFPDLDEAGCVNADDKTTFFAD
ncbi:MAG: hypothetical protein ABF699_13680 [Lacticaseibacillus paracasei]